MNPTVDGRISWEHENSYTSDSNEKVERWQNQLQKVTMLNCNMMVRSLRYVKIEPRELPTYDVLTAMDEVLSKFEITIPKQ